jgi:hypothetical protein
MTSLTYRDYTVGWICILPTEMAAARDILDEHHNSLLSRSHDDNAYIFGRLGDHNVVIACLPFGATDTTSATNMARDMLDTFDLIRFDLIIGIESGMPNAGNDIRLGDIMVSKSAEIFEDVIQYNFSKMV